LYFYPEKFTNKPGIRTNTLAVNETRQKPEMGLAFESIV
jgi:hypothetical protein